MRYGTAPTAYYFDQVQQLPHQFNVPDHVAVKTGLLDASGKDIFRLPEKIGYVTEFGKATT